MWVIDRGGEKKLIFRVVKKWWWLPMLVLFVPGLVRADGMVIPKPSRTITETAQKAVIWYEEGTETLILSTVFRGNTEEFAWLVPVPSRPDVTTVKDELFISLEDYTRPKYQDSMPMPMMGVDYLSVKEMAPTPGVRVLETKKVDIYETATLEANDSEALADWLTENGYEYPNNKDLLLKYYINKKWFFVAAKVNAESIGYAGTALSTGHAAPLSITFASDQIVYPLKISGPGSKYNEADKLAAFSFEDGLQGWGGGTVTSTEAYEGKRSLLLTGPTYIQPTPPQTSTGTVRFPTAYDRSVGRTITGIKKGTQYVFSAYLYSESDTGKVMLKAGSGVLQETSEEENLSSFGKWTRVSLPFVANSDGSVYLSVVIPQAQQEQEVYIDAVQLETGEEPSEFTKEIEASLITMPANQNVSLVMYVFADHKKTLPGWNTEYAGNVPAKDVSRMALDDDGNPWRSPKKTMYLTKLTKIMQTSEMTEDLFIRDAADNSAVGGASWTLGGIWRPVLVFGLLGGIELLILGYYWYSKSKRRQA